MIAKLAWRNLRRQIGGYLLYFCALALTAALIFSATGMLFCRAVLAAGAALDGFFETIAFLTALVALVSGAVLAHANLFFLRLRQREFGVYLALGMTRKDLRNLFLTETLLLFALSLVLGGGAGFLLFQGFLALLSHMAALPQGLSAYPVEGATLAALLLAGVYLFSCAFSLPGLRRVQTGGLLQPRPGQQAKKDAPVRALAAALFCLVGLAACYFACKGAVRRSLLQGENGAGIAGSLLLAAAFLIGFTAALAKGAVGVLLKRRRFCHKGSRVFMLRLLNERLRANAALAGKLALMVAVSVVGVNVAAMVGLSEEALLLRRYPYDVCVQLPAGREDLLTAANELVEEAAPVAQVVEYTVWTDGSDALLSCTGWAWPGAADACLSLSDYNALRRALGEPELSLSEEYLVLSDISQTAGYDFSQIVLQKNGGRYSFAGCDAAAPRLASAYFLAVLPDEAVSGMRPAETCMVWKLAPGAAFDAGALDAALRDLFKESGAQYVGDFAVREAVRASHGGSMAILSIGALYVSSVFLLLALALLSIELLGSAEEERKSFEILQSLGGDGRTCARALCAELLSFFVLPFVLPLLLMFPCVGVCAVILRGLGVPEALGEAAFFAGASAVLIAAVCALYFAAAYLAAKRKVFGGR